MSITDELRKWAKGSTLSSWTAEHLTAIADCIDAEHEKAMSRAGQLLADAEKDRDYNYANWQECKQNVLQHNITMAELDAEIERLKDELAHRIELPKDADGEYIHIGDEVYQVEGGWVYTVESITLRPDNTTVTFSCKHGFGCDSAHNVRHYHAPTVEDLLRQFLGECEHASMLGYTDMPQDIFDTYTSKLRLAGDAE